jgi:hypothetical protein
MKTLKQVEDAAWDVMGDDEDRYFGGSMAEAADKIITLVYKIMTEGSCTNCGDTHPIDACV